MNYNKILLSTLVACCLSLFSCFDTKTTHELKRIDGFESGEKNLYLLMDMLSYQPDYLERVSYELGITDTSILNHILIDHTVPKGNNTPTAVNVSFTGQALLKKDDIIPIIQRMIDEKYKLHIEKHDTVNLAVQKAFEFSKLLQSENFKEWEKLAGKTLRKEKFYFNELIINKSRVDLKGTRELKARKIIHTEDLFKEIFPIFFSYDSDIHERITIAFIDDNPMVVGYTIIYPKK